MKHKPQSPMSKSDNLNSNNLLPQRFLWRWNNVMPLLLREKSHYVHDHHKQLMH